MRRLSLMVLLFIGICLITANGETKAGNDAGNEVSEEQNLWKELADGFDARINMVGFGVAQGVTESVLNTRNWFGIPRYRYEFHLRPDFDLNFRRLELSLKPRWELRSWKWEDGILDGESDTEGEVFVNEWLARYRLNNKVFVSYGRENLQWGPSYLLSPSNPFNPDNGRNNPRLEIPGMDYGRVVWVPSSTWTASFIAHTDDGRRELTRDFEKQIAYYMENTTASQRELILDYLKKTYPTYVEKVQEYFGREFEETYAIKVDYTGEGKYFSLIPSYQEGEDFRLGFFAGWTASDALLLYTEGNVSDEDDVQFLIGGAYTFEMGPSIAVEYYRSQDGCTKEPIEYCFIYDSIDPEDLFFRKNYILLQYVDTKIMDTINLTLRWIQNLDDNSGRAIGIVGYELGDHAQLFIVGNFFCGGTDTEFGSLLDYSVMAGVGYTF